MPHWISNFTSFKINKICLQSFGGYMDDDDLKSMQVQVIESMVNDSLYSLPQEPVKRNCGWYLKIDSVGIM